ncbi:glycosyltransferase [Bacillus cereus]|uniref:tetratricopeptide repeat-containing glycosyltransferase family 2 protein n=1 Tax=Bacillus cereus TaxID=1396 RepID=UPI00191F9B55|nr:glycosyltransferase [Bacillus cereus]QQU33933.1 glycosyltransferase [Bacillus cereus]
MKPFLSACLIVKNEEEMLRKCLESLRMVVEEIIVVDTGSTDSTKEIAKQFTDKVYDFEWTNDFSEARNFAASKANGEWIVAIDADECVDPDNFKEAINEIKSHQNKFNMYLVEITSFSGTLGENTTVNQMPRIYINDGTICYKRAIHEQLEAAEGELRVSLSSLKVYHYGYLLNVVVKQNKENRNIQIIEKEMNKEDNIAFSYFNYGQELRRLNKQEEALNHFIKAYTCKKSVDEGWVRTCLFYIIECLVMLKRFEEALEIVGDTEELWPLAPDFTFWKGEIYFLQKRYDDAKEIYQNILVNNEIYTDIIYHFDRKTFLPHERLGQIYEIENNEGEAINHYIQALNENSLSVRIATKIVHMLCKYYRPQEVYEFINNQNLIKTNIIRIEIMKCLLHLGYVELATLLADDMEDGKGNLINIIQIKVDMITTMKDAIIIFETEDLLLGIQNGVFDLADLCILYEITKDKRIKDVMRNSNFSHVFEFLFEEPKAIQEIKEEEYLVLLDRACRYNKPDFVEKLISYKHFLKKNSDAKIADVFYTNEYEDIAIDFYQLADEKDITEQGYVNIIEWLIKNNNTEEAYRIAVEAVDKYSKDFRFYKYAIELMEEDREGIMMKGLKMFSNSNWLRKNLILSI